MSVSYLRSVRLESCGETLGDAMSGLRAWLDRQGIEPLEFDLVHIGGAGLGFNIRFGKKQEADLFIHRFS